MEKTGFSLGNFLVVLAFALLMGAGIFSAFRPVQNSPAGSVYNPTRTEIDGRNTQSTNEPPNYGYPVGIGGGPETPTPEPCEK